jgi:hypothetical protein
LIIRVNLSNSSSLATQNRQRCSQFVRNAGGELLHLPDRILQSAQRFVERLRQLIDFVACASEWQALLQLFDVDVARRGSQLPHRPQSSARHFPAHDGRGKNAERRQKQKRPQKSFSRIVRRRHGNADPHQKSWRVAAAYDGVVKAQSLLLDLQIGVLMRSGQCARFCRRQTHTQKIHLLGLQQQRAVGQPENLVITRSIVDEIGLFAIVRIDDQLHVAVLHTHVVPQENDTLAQLFGQAAIHNKVERVIEDHAEQRQHGGQHQRIKQGQASAKSKGFHDGSSVSM